MTTGKLYNYFSLLMPPKIASPFLQGFQAFSFCHSLRQRLWIRVRRIYGKTWTGETKILAETPLPLLLYPPRFTCRQNRARIRLAVVTRQRLTALVTVESLKIQKEALSTSLSILRIPVWHCLIWRFPAFGHMLFWEERFENEDKCGAMMEWYWQGKLNYWENVSHHFVDHKPHF